MTQTCPLPTIEELDERWPATEFQIWKNHRAEEGYERLELMYEYNKHVLTILGRQ